MSEKKPRVRFCWECGAKLFGNHFKEVEIDGHKRIMHKQCSDPDRELIDKEDIVFDKLENSFDRVAR